MEGVSAWLCHALQVGWAHLDYQSQHFEKLRGVLPAPPAE